MVYSEVLTLSNRVLCDVRAVLRLIQKPEFFQFFNSLDSSKQEEIYDLIKNYKLTELKEYFECVDELKVANLRRRAIYLHIAYASRMNRQDLVQAIAKWESEYYESTRPRTPEELAEIEREKQEEALRQEQHRREVNELWEKLKYPRTKNFQLAARVDRDGFEIIEGEELGGDLRTDQAGAVEDRSDSVESRVLSGAA